LSYPGVERIITVVEAEDMDLVIDGSNMSSTCMSRSALTGRARPLVAGSPDRSAT